MTLFEYDRRLQVGMRLIQVGTIPLVHYTYEQVLGLLRSVPRPVKILFSDTNLGTVEDRERMSVSTFYL